MTFDEAIEELEKNVKGKNIPADVVVYFFEKMREEYAQTINMTKEQYIGLLFKGKGRETHHKNFVFMKDVQKLNEKQVSIISLMNAFVHPETIKVIEEKHD